MKKLTYVFYLSLFIFSGCFGQKESQQVSAETTNRQSVFEKIVANNRLRVGFSSFEPWAMLDSDGDLIGFEIDVAQKLASDAGLELELVNTDWSGIIPALLNDKFDVIIGGMTITPQRNLQVNFSDAYAYTGMAMAANRGEQGSRDNLEDYNNQDVVLAVRSGATSILAIERLLPLATIRRFDNEAQMVQEVRNGSATAFVSALPQPNFLALDEPENFFIPAGGEQFTEEATGFAIRRGDYDFLNFLNNWIAAQWKNGFLEERSSYWFKSKDWEK